MRTFLDYFWWLLAGLAGFGWTLAGVKSNDIIWSTFGSALLGASIGGFVTKITTAKDKKEISSILDEIKGPYLRSEDEQLQPYRRKWHLYNVTRKKGQYVWRYRIIDFSNHLSVGELIGNVETPGLNNEKHKYIIRGAFRGAKLVLFSKVDGKEPHELYVIPLMGGVQFEHNTGIVIYRTWDHTDGIFPVIISPENILSSRKAGDVVKENDINYLNTTWRENFDQKYEFFPEVKPYKAPE
ncbi:hypothetical protein ACQKP8_27065 [Photobacterium alginatilyticum]|uniref:hypothetical protein n=1 Tax=Photobacterium alginatilyticum TaxID=1775171 RepID=UPI0040698419